MKKTAIIFAIAAAITLRAGAQSIVDPGVSTHNYKHPNKAAQARKIQKSEGIRVVDNSRTQPYYRNPSNGVNIVTPKYASRPAALVIRRSYPVQGLVLNPLAAPENYKTPFTNPAPNRSAVAVKPAADSLRFPTID